VLTNSFEVQSSSSHSEFPGAYAEAAKMDYVSKTSFNSGSKSVNFNEFMKVYLPAKNNAVEALLQTPAGKVAS